MARLGGLFLLGLVMLIVSCEKCMTCSYTYTVTTIQQTVNGEQEVVTTYQGWVQKNDSVDFTEECIKKDKTFTIETEYQLFADTTTLDDFKYTCAEQ